MLKSILLCVVFMLTFIMQKEDTYSANIKASNVHWLGKKTTGQHEGDVKIKRGSIVFNGTTPTSGEFVLDMQSISCTDIKDADDNQSLVDHLKGKDFFDIEASPESILKIMAFEKSSTANAYNVKGNLTIKGITNVITFPAIVTTDKTGAKATATITIDRTKWNISYKSKSILGSVADKFIYDDVQFNVNLVLNKGK